MFHLYQTDDGHELPFEYLPCAALTPKYGMTMVMSGGKLSLASGAVKPTYICAVESSRSVTAGTIIPAVRIDTDQRWRTETSASSFSAGTAYTLASTGLGVTTTSTSGVFTVDGLDTDAGYVYGRFL